MKPGRSDSEFLVVEGEFLGVCLGYDFVAQHEHGVSRIYQDFGAKFEDPEVFGLEKRRFNTIPKKLKLIENNYKDINYIHLVSNTILSFRDPDKLEPVSEIRGDRDFVTAWDTDSFGISVMSDNNIKAEYLKQLYDAFLNKDVALVFVSRKDAKGNPFGRTSPFLGIISKMDPEFLKGMDDFDINEYNLKKASKETGLEELLKENNLDWYALTPHWTGKVVETIDNRILKTKYPVIYYLNPRDQKKYKSGWFTVEDLKLWPHEVGPVVKEPKGNALDMILRED